MKKRKKSQVTIFIILGIMIVIVLLFIFNQNFELKSIFSQNSPSEEIENCAKESLSEAIELISVQGSVFPENYYLHEGEKIEYLCYTDEDYSPCVIQKPLIKDYIENEIKEYSKNKINACFKSVKEKFEKGDYQVNYKSPLVNVEVVPQNIRINIESDLKIVGKQTENYQNLKINQVSELYELVMIASSIINNEVEYGDSETLNYMLKNPSLKVEKRIQDDGTRIYKLTKRNSGNSFVFASRSYAMPAGLIDTEKGVTK